MVVPMSGSNNKLTADYYYGVEYNGKFEIFTQKNTNIPYKAKRYLSTHEDNQTKMKIKVHFRKEAPVQSERGTHDLKLDGISSQPKGSVVVEVCIWVDSSNVCYASMEELTSGRKCVETFKGKRYQRFNMGEMENITEDVVKPPEVIAAKKHSEVKVELCEKVKLLKELRENKGEGAIQSAYLNGVIQRAEILLNRKKPIPEDREMKEMIKEVEKVTSCFYDSEFQLEGDLGYYSKARVMDDKYRSMIPEDSKIPCKIVDVIRTWNRKFEFYEADEYGRFLTGSPKLGEINVEGIPTGNEWEYFETCVEICTSGVLYASVEHFKTRKILYAIIHKARKCTKREVEEKIRVVKTQGIIREGNREVTKRVVRRTTQCAEYYNWLRDTGRIEVVIQNKTEVPYKAKRYFTTYEDNQRKMEVYVFYRKETGQNKLLKLIKISPKPKEAVVFKFCIWFDPYSSCYVSIENLITRRKDAWTFTRGVDGFNVGEMDNIPEVVAKLPEVIGTKIHSEVSEVKVELCEKLKLLKELRENKGEGAIESEYLNGVIQRAQNLVGQSAIPESESRKMIKEVEKVTSFFYESDFEWDRDLGLKTGDEQFYLIPKNSKNCKIIKVYETTGKKFEFFEEEADENGMYLTGVNLIVLGEINVDEIPELGPRFFEVGMEICTSGVLYASVEHLKTRKIFYAIIHKGRKCTKREVEGKIKFQQDEMSGRNIKLSTDEYLEIEYIGKFEVVIEKDTNGPHKAKMLISTFRENQTEMEIKLHKGIEPSVQSKGVFCQLKLKGISPQPKGSVVAEVCIWLDSSNHCYASLEELAEGGRKDAWTSGSFNMGEMENIPENVVKPPEIYPAKAHSEVKVELDEKLKLLKELKENKGEGAIESEYLKGIIQRAENIVKSNTSPKEMKKSIRDVEKFTSLFYNSEFKLEHNLGFDDGYNYHLLIPKNSKLPCKVLRVDNISYRKFEFVKGTQQRDGRFIGGEVHSLQEIDLDKIPQGCHEVCMEICTSGVLYVSVEHLETRKIFYNAIADVTSKCIKSEVEARLQAEEWRLLGPCKTVGSLFGMTVEQEMKFLTGAIGMLPWVSKSK